MIFFHIHRFSSALSDTHTSLGKGGAAAAAAGGVASADQLFPAFPSDPFVCDAPVPAPPAAAASPVAMVTPPPVAMATQGYYNYAYGYPQGANATLPVMTFSFYGYNC